MDIKNGRQKCTLEMVVKINEHIKKPKMDVKNGGQKCTFKMDVKNGHI
jgi:hypothetical protein